MRICIDPGHGGGDPGAVGRTGLRECDVTLDVAKRLAHLLRADGHQVVMTRESDRDVSYAGSSNNEELGARVDVSNKAKAEVFVSIHCNAASDPRACGTEVFHVPGQAKSGAYAGKVLAALVKIPGLVNRGIKLAGFYVLTYTDCPAILVELAFISNPGEEAKLGQAQFLEALAEAIRDGLVGPGHSYLKPGSKPAPKTSKPKPSKKGGKPK